MQKRAQQRIHEVALPPLWRPEPGPQTIAYCSQADELFYGGAAGGGKTDLLIGLGSTQGKSTIVLRRTYPQLKGIIERCDQLLAGTGAKYNGQDKIWRGVRGGRRLEFGSMQYEADKNAYRGRPHDIWCWDEVTEFTKTQYEFVGIWARSADPSQRVRTVVAGNPPTTAEGEWVLERWAAWLDDAHPNPAQPGELRWYARVGDKEIECEDGEPFEYGGEMIEPMSRTFVPAFLEDNPYLKDSGYRGKLQALEEPLRSMFLWGIMSAAIRGDPWQVIPVEWVKAAQYRWKNMRPPDVPLSALGVDVARGGQDKTVLAERYGTWVAPLQKVPGRETRDGPAVVELVVPHMTHEGIEVMIDVIGVGTSPYDLLKGLGYNVTPMNAGVKSYARDKSGLLQIRNKRAEWWWNARELLDPSNNFNIALPNDSELRAELCSAKWKVPLGVITIESKEDIRKRLGRSTDCADAVVMVLAGDLPGEGVSLPTPGEFHQDSRWTPPREEGAGSRWTVGGGRGSRSKWRP